MANKKILGLDLGTNSIGWALVNVDWDDIENNSITKLGVRVNPLTVDEQMNFEKGKSITTNADRTLKRSARRNLQRYKLRRENLIEILLENKIITDDFEFSEIGNKSTFNTYKCRAIAVKEKISLDEIAKILLMINKKRGYKSSRKANNQEEGKIVDGMSVAKEMYERKITPGQFSFSLLKQGKKLLPDYYRSDLILELKKLWNFQKQFGREIINDDNYEYLITQNKKGAIDFFEKKLNLTIHEVKGNAIEKKIERYEIRDRAQREELSDSEIALAVVEILNEISNSSGYLGAISDRSKELYFNNITVGQYLWNQIENDRHVRIMGQVFYRNDYMDEFERIWDTQSAFYPQLTNELKSEVRDVIIFYQRRLKSQKGLISYCEFEKKEIKFTTNGKVQSKFNGPKVCPRSSPLFQEFKIWQIINNLKIINKTTGEVLQASEIEIETRQYLFDQLNVVDSLKKNKVLDILMNKPKEYDLNYESVEGNRTNAVFYKSFSEIAILSGHEIDNFDKLDANVKYTRLFEIFQALGINTNILKFNSSLEGDAIYKQDAYIFWHLLYSYEDDNSITGIDSLVKKLFDLYGFEKEYAVLLSNISFQDDYASLSSKAIKNILTYLKEGNSYDVACTYAKYNHSNSVTKEENDLRVLKDRLSILPKNSLRNPVVEKILNQMINVVNSVSETYGKPDEIRIELARELKNSAKEREDMTKAINKSKDDHEKYRKILKNEFGLNHVSRNDIIRYKLYLELAHRGYKTIYTNTYIAREKLFSKEFDIEHIIPQSRLYDDSFSNKTLETRSANIEKSDTTAYDYISNKYGDEIAGNYAQNVEDLYRNFKISKAKKNKLLMREQDIPDGFIERDLRDSQYIAKKAKEILLESFKVVLSTTGKVTDKLRQDWQLIDVMKEINWTKYDALGLTNSITNRDGNVINRITDWTKRNDHRHHAMDALTVAFTDYNHIQYLNYMNARKDENHKQHRIIMSIENKSMYRDDNNKLKFKPPMAIGDFRNQAKMHLENILVSFKAKNKVATMNKNKIKVKKGKLTKTELTPRGQLHLETVYGKINRYKTTELKISNKFTKELIDKVANKKVRIALLNRLNSFDNDPVKAFSGKNSILKNPIYLDEQKLFKVPEKVKIVEFEDVFTIKKEINPDLNISKVVDSKIKKILEKRLEIFHNDAKKAFSNLNENPIWLNKEKGIKLKRVKLSGISNAVSLHSKKDKNGKIIMDSDGYGIPVDFVNTGNNHHVAVYVDKDGGLHEKVVTFFEALERKRQNLSIVDKIYNSNNGWELLFTMKQNEFFIFPNEQTGFNPKKVDLFDMNNYHLISPNLFRVQKISSKNYMFAHHLETKAIDGEMLKNNKKAAGILYKSVRSLPGLENALKVRVNHIGQIVSVGEYD